MIGCLLLLVAIFFYVKGRKKYSLLIFLSFVSGGFQLLSTNIIGVKLEDLAFFYIVIINIYSYCCERYCVEENQKVKRFVKYLFIFLILSALFSLFYYGFTIFQVIQGGRMLFLFMSYYFLRKVNIEDALWIFKVMYYITFITSILYIIEVITGLPVLPYGEPNIDEDTGLLRYYNSPTYLALFIYAIIIFPEYFWDFKFKKIAPYVFCLAQICTLGRTEIITVVVMVFIGMIMKGNRRHLIKIATIGTIFFIPFSSILISRFNTGAGTQNDLTAILKGEFVEYANSGAYSGQGTMTYRFAWVYERVLYLSDRPLLENIFGLGMISDSQIQLVQAKYNFLLGLESDETGYRQMMSTPDIAYGNFITQFGYLGGIILLMLWVFVAKYLYKNRQLHPVILLVALTVIGYFFRSISGSVISSTGNLNMPFLFMSIIPQLKQMKY